MNIILGFSQNEQTWDMGFKGCPLLFHWLIFGLENLLSVVNCELVMEQSERQKEVVIDESSHLFRTETNIRDLEFVNVSCMDMNGD